MTGRAVRSLGIIGPGEAAVLDLVEPEPGPGQVWVRTLWSGISAGTEVAVLRGHDPHHTVGWDRDRRLFGTGAKSGYPVPRVGYMEVGRVEESGAPGLPEGTLVALACGHVTGHSADPTAEPVIPLPEDLDPVLGVFVAQMGPISANGLLHAAVELGGPGADPTVALRGRRVLVTGAGVVGLLAALLAQQHGAEVLVVEPSEDRRAAAVALGLRSLPDHAEVSQEVKDEWSGPLGGGADVALQCRGHSGSLMTALSCLRPQRTVVDLAFYQGGAPDLRLGEEFHHNWLAIRCAQIGRVPAGMEHEWDRSRLAGLTLDLLRGRGPGLRRHLVTHVLPLDEGPGFLSDMAARRRPCLTAVLQMSAE